MAGLRGNQAYLGVAKQTAKGSPAASAQAQLAFSGGTIAPTKVVNQLSETDSNRQQGVSYVEQTAMEGSPETYVRDANIHFLLNAALGSTVDTGATNFVHTTTPSAALPYMTFWKGLGGVLWERYDDTMVSGLTISAQAGGPLTAALDIVGLKSTRLATDPVLLPWTAPADKIASGQVLNFNNATVTLSGGATALVSSFELAINNNVTLQQTDDSVPYDVVPGTLEVTLAFDLIFETLTEYNLFHYPTGGLTQGPTIYTTSANFAFSLGANNGLTFDFPSIAYEEFPVDPNPGGDPVVASIRARAQRNASYLMQAVTKNQAATT